MGKYLDMLQPLETKPGREISEQSEKSPGQVRLYNPPSTLFRLNRFFRTFQELERRCPDYVDRARWEGAVEDGRRFLAKWGDQAEAMGWTARDLFGLHKPAETPDQSYRRLSRYDETGLIWLLKGREVTAVTADTAAIRSSSGTVTVYRKHNKPALGPLGDSLDDFR